MQPVEKYSADLRRHAVQMVIDRRADYPSEIKAIKAVAEELGIEPVGTLRNWVRRGLAPPPVVDTDLGERGQRLYDALTVGSPGEPVKVLAEEAARLADRLDDLDAIIKGKGVLQLMRFRLGLDFSDDHEREIIVKIDMASVLGEARQQSASLRQLIEALGFDQVAQSPPASGGTGLDELKKRRADRQAKS